MNNNTKDANKRIFKNTLLLYIRQFFVLTLGLYTTRLTLHVLGEYDYGVFAAVGGVTALLSLVAGTLSSGTQRFITFELGKNNYKKLNLVYITSINIHALLSLLLVLLGESIGVWFVLFQLNVPQERVWAAFWVFQITLLNSVLTLINVPNNAEIIAHEDMGVYALITIVDTILKLISVLALFYITWDKLVCYSLFFLFIQSLNRAICLWFCKKNYKEVSYRWIYDKKLFKEMLCLSGWAGLSNLSITGFIQGVSIILNVFWGPAMNAAYAVALQAYSGLRTFSSSFQLAANPQIVKLYSSNELEGMRSLLYSVCKVSFFLVFFISFPFLFNANFILGFWLGRVPAHAETFFCLLLLYSYIDVLAYPLDVAAQATGKIKKYSIGISAGVLVVLPISYLFYIFGAFAETIYLIAIICSWICLFYRLTLLNQLINIKVNVFIKRVLLRIIVVIIFSSCVPFILKYYCYDDLNMVILNFITCLFMSAIFIYYLGLSGNEKIYVKNLFATLKKKTLSCINLFLDL